MAVDAQTKPRMEQRSLDGWGTAWGEAGLQDLGRWLERQGVSPDDAALTVERTWLFYSYFALPILRRRLPMGIAGGARSTRGPAICFYLPFGARAEGSDDDSFAADGRAALLTSFEREVSTPLRQSLSVGLRLISARPDRVERLATRLQSYCDRLGLEFIGLFRDELAKELATILSAEVLSDWLTAPNPALGWVRPLDSLDDPTDYRLRDVIARAKFGLPAA